MHNGLTKYEYYYETLRENSLFTDLQNESLKKLLEIASNQLWPKKTCVLDPEHTLFKFYILISGKIKEYNYDDSLNRELIHAILTKNDFFNVSTLLNGHASRLFYEALSYSELICVPMDQMRLWIKENPKIIQPILNYLADKTEKLKDKVFDLCSLDTSTRLAKLLIDHLNKDTNKIELINGLSNTTLAGLIGTTRAVLNRHLQEFKREGILQIGHHNINIVNSALLIEKAQTLPTANHSKKPT